MSITEIYTSYQTSKNWTNSISIYLWLIHILFFFLKCVLSIILSQFWHAQTNARPRIRTLIPWLENVTNEREILNLWLSCKSIADSRNTGPSLGIDLLQIAIPFRTQSPFACSTVILPNDTPKIQAFIFCKPSERQKFPLISFRLRLSLVNGLLVTSCGNLPLVSFKITR